MSRKYNQDAEELALVAQALANSLAMVQAAEIKAGHTTISESNAKLLQEISELENKVYKLLKKVMKARDRAQGY